MSRIRVDTSRCTGCRMCEIACSAWHEGEFRPSLARLRIESDPSTGRVQARVCTQDRCGRCLDVCPTGAIKPAEVDVRSPSGTMICRVLVVDGEVCNGCGECVDVCPMNVIALHPVAGKALKCDLCGGEPQCLEACQNPLVNALALRVG